jgi:hypothetical protein
MNAPAKIKLVRAMMPTVLIPLIRRGHLTNAHLEDIASARRELLVHLHSTLRDTRFHLRVQTEFAEEASAAWRAGKRWIAITLLATALEQCVNITLRIILEAKGYEEGSVTATIKKYNINDKMTWLWQMHTHRQFPERLLSRAQKVFEIRNSVVHFKGAPWKLDEEADSSSKIDKDLTTLAPFHIDTFFRRFEEFCADTTLKCDPRIDLALKLAAKLCD